MTIGFILFEQFWQRKSIGSSRIRGTWVMEELNKMEGVQAEPFVQGKMYDVLIFQKVYWKEMARNAKALKILDICDPDWLDGAEVVSFMKEMDIVTTSTERLAEDLRKMTDKPVYCIPDRVKMDGLPTPKQHHGQAKKVVWFGYSHNIDVLEPAYLKLRKMNLILLIIADGNVQISDCQNEFLKWDIETVNQNIQNADIVLLPEWTKGRFAYKSNNKTLQSWALGMPVAKTPADLERFLDPEERNKEAKIRYQEVLDKWQVKQSADELVKIIKIWNSKD